MFEQLRSVHSIHWLLKFSVKTARNINVLSIY